MGTIYTGVYTVPVEPTSCRLRFATLTGWPTRRIKLIASMKHYEVIEPDCLTILELKRQKSFLTPSDPQNLVEAFDRGHLGILELV